MVQHVRRYCKGAGGGAHGCGGSMMGELGEEREMGKRREEREEERERGSARWPAATAVGATRGERSTAHESPPHGDDAPPNVVMQGSVLVEEGIQQWLCMLAYSTYELGPTVNQDTELRDVIVINMFIRLLVAESALNCRLGYGAWHIFYVFFRRSCARCQYLL